MELRGEEEEEEELFITMVRLDNILEDPHRRMEAMRLPIDRLWRDCVGWPQPVIISFPATSILLKPFNLTLPPSLYHDVMEIRLDNPGFVPLAPPSTREIPPKIFQFWHQGSFEEAPAVLKKAMDTVIFANPGYEHHFVNLHMARAYIRKREGRRALKAFDELLPVAYKTDLWRHIILYYEGGIYLDSKINAIVPLDALLPSTGALITNDRGNIGLLNGIIAVPPKDPLMRTAIDMILYQVRNKFYGPSPLAITGPLLLERALKWMPEHLIRERYMCRLTHDLRGVFVWMDKPKIPAMCVHSGEYRRSLMGMDMKEHYGLMWAKQEVYGPARELLQDEYQNLVKYKRQLAIYILLTMLVFTVLILLRTKRKRSRLIPYLPF